MTTPLTFLGEWCRLYERRHVWGTRAADVVPYMARSRQAGHDYAHLAELHERLLGALAAPLGQEHALARPVRFWRTLLDPWLVTYYRRFDRWETLRLRLRRRADI